MKWNRWAEQLVELRLGEGAVHPLDGEVGDEQAAHPVRAVVGLLAVVERLQEVRLHDLREEAEERGTRGGSCPGRWSA